MKEKEPSENTIGLKIVKVLKRFSPKPLRVEETNNSWQTKEEGAFVSSSQSFLKPEPPKKAKPTWSPLKLVKKGLVRLRPRRLLAQDHPRCSSPNLTLVIKLTRD